MPGNGRIFISHSHADNERCQPLLDALASWGADYWFDLAQLDVGQDLSDRIQRAIKERDVFIRVCSRGVQANPYWVDLETEAFRALQARDEQAGEHGKRVLIPLVLDADYELQPFELASLYLDAVHTTPDVWTARLHSALAVRLGQGVQPFARVVDWRGGAQYHSIGEAIAAAQPGDRILIHPGIYQEAVVIDRAVELVGDGALGDVVIETMGKNVVRFTASNGRIANLTLRQKGGGEYFGIAVTSGRLAIEGCDITSQSLACVGVHDGAEARILRNRIHDGAQAGVVVYNRGQAAIEDNEIAANALSGIAVESAGSSATIRRNRLHDGKQSGVYVIEGAQAILEDNEIASNALAGIEVKNAGSSATIRRNQLHTGKQTGVYVWEGAQAILEDNEIMGNAFNGVRATNAGSSATVRSNRINRNQRVGVAVDEGAAATVADNDLRGNQRGAFLIDDASKDKVRRERNQE